MTIEAHAPLKQLESLARTAVKCRACFDQGWVSAPLIDIAQPRWVGPGYWTARQRIAVLALNPGSGKYRENRGGTRPETADERARRLLHSFADGTTPLEGIFDHQTQDMPNWGRGRFKSFFFHRLALDINATAFGNIAWCASQGDKYPPIMLRACFQRHTKELLRILNPHVVILSGDKAHKFRTEVQGLLPTARIECTIHYGHRKGYDREEAEVTRLLAALASGASVQA